MKYFATYITMTFVMLIVDMLWLGIIAKPIYFSRHHFLFIISIRLDDICTTSL
jgi:uncharacterized membrane protein